MPEEQSVLEKVTEIVFEQLGLGDDEEVVNETHLRDDLGADSLDLVELVMALEEKYDVEVTDEEAEKVGTMGDLVALVEAALAKRN